MVSNPAIGFQCGIEPSGHAVASQQEAAFIKDLEISSDQTDAHNLFTAESHSHRDFVTEIVRAPALYDCDVYEEVSPPGGCQSGSTLKTAFPRGGLAHPNSANPPRVVVFSYQDAELCAALAGDAICHITIYADLPETDHTDGSKLCLAGASSVTVIPLPLVSTVNGSSDATSSSGTPPKTMHDAAPAAVVLPAAEHQPHGFDPSELLATELGAAKDHGMRENVLAVKRPQFMVPSHGGYTHGDAADRTSADAAVATVHASEGSTTGSSSMSTRSSNHLVLDSATAALLGPLFGQHNLACLAINNWGSVDAYHVRHTLKKLWHLLAFGGELLLTTYISDRRMPHHLHGHPVVRAHGVQHSLYVEDFRRFAWSSGFLAPRLVSIRPYAPKDHRAATLAELQSALGNLKVYEVTFRLFKLPKHMLDATCEDYGQSAIYLGTIEGCEECYCLDAHHKFVTGQPTTVCGNTAAMLGEAGLSWLAPHFQLTGSRAVHFGRFSGAGLLGLSPNRTKCCG